MRRRLPLAAVLFTAVLLLAGVAGAETIPWTGQGTTDGACDQFEGDGTPDGSQTWHFVLTQSMEGATMSASFSDGTVVTDVAADDHTGKVNHWFIVSTEGALLQSASADYEPDGPNPQFVVSHCELGGGPPTTLPPTTQPPTTQPPTTQPPTTQPPTSAPPDSPTSGSVPPTHPDRPTSPAGGPAAEAAPARPVVSEPGFTG